MTIFENSFPLHSVFEGASDIERSVLYKKLLLNATQKLIPMEGTFSSDVAVECCFALVQNALPILKADVWGSDPFGFSVQVICLYQPHAAKFFQEIISRWLLPGKKLSLDSFFSIKFSAGKNDSPHLLLAEAVVKLSSEKELENVRRNLLILENEIFLGLSSYLHALRILEVKGVSSNEKNALIQDALSVLIQKKPQIFDYELFSTMQQLMLLAREEFIHDRECFHLVRIIYAVYLFKKKLEFISDQHVNVRHILLKISSLRIHLPFETKKVLGLFVGINFLHKNEVFDESHVLKSITNYIPEAILLENSTIIFPSPDEKLQVIYLEIKKRSGEYFSLEEVSVLRQKLSSDLKHHVEKLMPAVFMPRNEEEVMKNILVLSHELKYFRDLPQVIISFDEQAENELVFTIIYLRLLLERDASSIEKLYKKNYGRFVFEVDRVKNVGMLRGKYPKEASVFRLRLPKHVFLREDLTLDLLKARQEVVYELHHVLGEFRDYNGGMIARQTEVLSQLKMEMFHLDKNQELLLENFFHSLVPMEARTVVPLETLKNLFYCWLESAQKDGLSCTFYEYQTYTCLVTKSKEAFNKEMVASVVKGLGVASCQLITALIQHEDIFYLCSLLISEEKSVRGQWQKIAAEMSAALCGSFS